MRAIWLTALACLVLAGCQPKKQEWLRIDPSLEPKQVERLRALRAKRNAETWQAAIRAVEDTARSGDNLMPRILAAVEANATVGEISDAMRKVYEIGRAHV